jgi:phage tail-like protein
MPVATLIDADVRTLVVNRVLDADVCVGVEYFERFLWQRLRDIDRIEDEKLAAQFDLRAADTGRRQGDLAAFLRVIGPSFDAIKLRIDQLPDFIDPDRCPADYLPYLGSIVGFEPPESMAEGRERKLLKLAIETYRRNGTMPSLGFDLRVADFEGDAEETYPKALRFGTRSRLAQAKLPGRVYGLGVYRVLTPSPLPEVKNIVRTSHPAGKKFFLTQRFQEIFPTVQATATHHTDVRKGVVSYRRHCLRLGRHTLGGPNVFTHHRETWTPKSSGISQVTPSSRAPAPKLRFIISPSPRSLRLGRATS